MKKFSAFLSDNSPAGTDGGTDLRQLAVSHRREFLKFRSITARDFLAEMRAYARSIKGDALVTCNNSLNTPGVFFSQNRTYGYDIHEMSKVEDWVTVEDMATQPRTLANGKSVEYAPTYALLHSISRGKPLVVCTLADGDYHTPPQLVRLAMAEAAAHDASYLSWPTWPENERPRMIATIRPQADLLRENHKFLNGTRARRDVTIFLPYRRWLETDKCIAADLAAELSRANIQFDVLSEDQFGLEQLRPLSSSRPVLLVESRGVLTDKESAIVTEFEASGGRVIAADETKDLRAEVKRVSKLSIAVDAPQTVRAVVRDQSNRTIIHLLNLNIQRLSSFQDIVHPAENVGFTCSVPFTGVRTVRALTADKVATTGDLSFTATPDGEGTTVQATVPALEIATILLIEQ